MIFVVLINEDYFIKNDENIENIRIKRITASADYRVQQLQSLRQGVTERIDDILFVFL